MRVVAGEVKGHRLKSPPGMETRPTSDKVREALFATLGGAFMDEAVLDLFAGTGALGIEALSRGAESAVFVERRPQACQAIRDNLEHTRLTDRARLMCMPVKRALELLDQPFGLILLDPPYAMKEIHDIMDIVGTAGIVGQDTIVVLEHSPRVSAHQRYGQLMLQRQKTYGDTAVSIYRVQKEQTA